MRYVSALCLSAIVVASCSPMRQAQRRVEKQRTAALKKIDVAQCEAGGGAVRYVCMYGTPACVTPYRDAGQPCTDNAQCKGKCLAPEGVKAGTSAVTGQCKMDDDPCGCFAEVVNGQAQDTWCYD